MMLSAYAPKTFRCFADKTKITGDTPRATSASLQLMASITMPSRTGTMMATIRPIMAWAVKPSIASTSPIRRAAWIPDCWRVWYPIESRCRCS